MKAKAFMLYYKYINNKTPISLTRIALAILHVLVMSDGESPASHSDNDDGMNDDNLNTTDGHPKEILDDEESVNFKKQIRVFTTKMLNVHLSFKLRLEESDEEVLKEIQNLPIYHELHEIV